MATSLDSSSMEDVALCSICFEKFKSPRFLPCTHSFCHGCLSSYIVSLCKSTETRLGFNCPLCREYTPSPGAFDKPHEWAGLFPVNEMLRKIVDKSDQLLCEPCLREKEEEEASDYCFSCLEHLCKICTKCHRKNMSSRDHKVSPLNELKSANRTSIVDISNSCATHKDEKIRLYCFDHEQPCCAMCGGMEHRRCEQFDTIENAVHVFKESGKVDSIMDDVNKFKSKLEKAKDEEEKNITEIENSVDEMIARSEEDFKTLLDHLQKLQHEHIEEISSSLKKSKEKLQTCIGTLTDGIQCAEYCSKMFEQARISEYETEFIMKFHTSKITYEHLKHVNFSRKRIMISAKKDPILTEILNMTALSDVHHTESSRQLYFDVRTVEMSLIKEFSIDGDVVCDGIFLSNGTFVIADYRDDGKCMFLDKHWVPSIFG
ncbi:tripartite motif-containing protein 45-like [Ostrea edulis]|uniref:tripartite motif-containing protein 45-like n=1 Tax=Ostrea edulis TaxID=37623 RepID=UPI0024AF7C31|nr:tripartite motif-containing protein 45-like [Ostrea edulis]